MASNTARFGLLKKDPVVDAADTFNIKTMMNDNWEKIDGAAKKTELDAHATDNTLHVTQAFKNEVLDGTRQLKREVANLNLQLEAAKRVPNGTTFGTDFNTTFGMTIDYTKTTVSGALAVGATVITVADVTGFAVGKEVTIYDDVALERKAITAIDAAAKTITVSALTKAFKDKAQVARSMAIADNVDKALKFGGWATSTSYTGTDATVVASAYDTSGNGGRKLIRTTNGIQFSVVRNGTTDYRIYKSADNWVTPGTLIATVTEVTNDLVLATNGTDIYAISSFSTTGVKFRRFDQAGTLLGVVVDVDTGQSAMGKVTAIVNDAKTEGHISWDSTNATYPNSRNTRYKKFTIATDGSVTWSAVVQVTAYNTAGIDVTNPSIVVKANGYPSIIAQYVDDSYSAIACFNYNGTGFDTAKWVSGLIAKTYIQSFPSAIFVLQSVNGLANGRIWVAWHGLDATDTTTNNIRVSYSDDGGVTWSAMLKLTAGNTMAQINASITANKKNEIFVLFEGATVSNATTDYRIKSIKNTGGTWGTVTEIKGAESHNPATLADASLDFAQPLFIYKSVTGAKVGFYGTWTVPVTAPLLENDVRFTTKDTDEVVTWVTRDAALTVGAQLNGAAMTKTTSGNEDQFVGTLSALGAAEVKLTMSRVATTDDVKITKILGGVS